MAELSETRIRATAIECASRAVQEGSPTGHFLSSARMFETYIRTGLTQVGPRFKQGLIVRNPAGTDWLVRVDGELSAECAERIRAALTNLLTEEQHDAEEGAPRSPQGT